MKFFSHIGILGRRLLFITLTITLVPLFAIGLLTVRHETGIISKHTLSSLEIIADYAGNEVLELINYLKGRTQDFSSDGFILDSVVKINNHGGASAKTVDDLNWHLAKNKLSIIPGAVETFIVNPAGIVIASSEPLRIGNVYSHMDWFVKGTDIVYVSDVYKSAGNGKPTWIIAAPLKEGVSKKFAGVIANRINPGVMNGIIDKHYTPHLGDIEEFKRVGESAVTYMINGDGLMLTNSNSEDNVILSMKVDTKPVLTALEHGKEMIGEYVDYKGIDVIGVSMFIEDMNWVILSEIDRGEARLPIRKFVIRASAMALVLVFVIFVLMFFTAQKIVSPIVDISKTFERIAKGQWEERVKVKDTKSEIAQLGNSFNSMVESFLDTFSSLLASERRFHSVVQDMPVMINAVDALNNFVVWNRDCERVTGYSAKEIINNPDAIELLYPDTENREYLMSKWISTNDDYRDREIQMTCKDGTVKSVLWSNISKQFPIPGWAKWVVGIDITKRKQMKLELVEKTIYLDSILRSSADIAIVAVNMDYRVKYYNPAAVQIFGFRAEEVVGKGVWELQKKTQIDAKPFIEALKIVSEGREHSFVIEQKKNHEVQYVEIRISGISDLESELIGIVLVAQDITERKVTEKSLKEYIDRLARSNTELEQFAYVASHDLQEPLRMISSYLQLLKRRYEGKLDSDADDFIWYAVDGATRMQELINALLAYSRVGTRGKEFASVECENVLSQVLINLQPAINESGTEIKKGDLPVVYGDKSQLGQLFQNLIGNAIKFCSENSPVIEINAGLKGTDWLFSISDNGIGIDPEQSNRIFLMFQRLHNREEYPGTGIGLAMCKKIVERHGGKIWVKSEPGSGATFYFSIPKNDDELAGS